MSKQLPPKPRLEQLKKQARDLRKAYQSADAEAMRRLREHLPRLSGASDDEIRQADVVLQEAQHVIAREYGFKNWKYLRAVVQIETDLLVRMSDQAVQARRLGILSLEGVVELAGDPCPRPARMRSYCCRDPRRPSSCDGSAP